jgi:outer membrane protein TolC
MYFAALVFMLIQGALWAQTGTDPAQFQKPKLVLDLDECIRLALERNPDFIMARQEVQMKEAAAASAYGRFFPSIDFQSRMTILDPTTVNDSKGTIPIGTTPITFQTVYSPLFTMGFTASYAIPGIPFFSDGAWGMVNAAHDLTLKDLGVTKNKLEKTKRDTKAMISKAFYQLKLSELMYTLTKANDERLGAYLDVAQRNYNAGRISQYELLRAQVQLANNQPELLRAENSARLARVALLQKLSLDLNLDLETKGELRVDYVQISEEKAVATALTNRSELQDIALSVEVLKLQEKMSKYGTRPQLAAFANFNWELKKKGSLFAQGDRQLYNNWTAGAQISIPISELLNPASTSWKGTAQYEHGVERAGTMQRNVESLIQLEIRQNVLLLEENRKTIDAQRTAMSLSTEGLRVARIAYNAGQVGNVELMDAELDFQRAQLMEYQAWYGYIAARIDLLNAMGVL